MCIDIDMIKIGIVTHHELWPLIYTRILIPLISLERDQAQQNGGPDQGLNCLTL